MITRISSTILLHCIFYKIKKLPEDRLTCCLKRRAIKGYNGLIEQLHTDVVINCFLNDLTLKITIGITTEIISRGGKKTGPKGH